MAFRVAVLASGRGSNLEALLRSLGDGSTAQVVLVVTNRAGAGALDVARRHRIPVHLLSNNSDPEEWRRVLADSKAELVVLAGYLKRVPAPIPSEWAGRMINIHPALLPRHGGPGMFGHHVHEAVLAAGERVSGATVHLVSDEYDQGSVLGQAEVPVLPGDSADTLAARVLELEHRLLPAAVLAAARAGRAVPFALESSATPAA